MDDHNTIVYCTKCGKAAAAGDQYCSRCGSAITTVQSEVGAAPQRTAPAVPASSVRADVVHVAPHDRRNSTRGAYWLVLPIVLGLIGVLGYKLLTGFPVRDRQEPRSKIDAVKEEEAPRRAPDLISDPRGDHSPPVAESKPRAAEISEKQAVGRLSQWLLENDYYKEATNCLELRSQGYKNRGYTVEVVSAGCPGGGDSVSDLWRVDALTQRVYRRRADGRYLSP